jgi:hypothetical protein
MPLSQRVGVTAQCPLGCSHPNRSNVCVVRHKSRESDASPRGSPIAAMGPPIDNPLSWAVRRTGRRAIGRTSVFDVRITIAERQRLSCAFPAQHSARSSLDNCFRDQAVTNARQLADLLTSADVHMAAPIA